MIQNRFAKQKKNRVLMIFIVFGCIAFLSKFIDGSYETYQSHRGKRLALGESAQLPIRELSGLFFERSSQTLYGIGDNTGVISVAKLTSDYQVEPQESLDVNQAILDKYSPCTSDSIPECHRLVKKQTSQWEAIAKSHPDEVFLLNEQLSSLFVFNTQTKDLITLINFDSYDLNGTKRPREKSTVDQSNAMGEGFLLLNNGHILVVKERFPPTFVEFAPIRDAVPMGYLPSLMLASDQSFSMNRQVDKQTFYPRKVWKIPAHFQQCDLSELAQDVQGKLFVMSQTCQWISQVEPLNPKQDEAIFSNTWYFPQNFRNAEAFVVLDDNTFLIGEDLASDKRQNLFFLRKDSLTNPPSETVPNT